MSKKTVRIEEYYDGFAIIVCDGDKEEIFHFDQDDDKKKLKNVFKALGIKAKYKEVY